MAFIYCVLKADEDAGGDTNDKDETKDDERGNKNKDEQAIIIFRIPGPNIYVKKVSSKRYFKIP